MTTYFPKPDILARIPLDTHAVIEASAGTGKTYTIEHLFVEVLLTQDVTVENVLVVTYTEKAAAELRSRVRKIVQSILECREAEVREGFCWAIDERQRIRLERALFSFDKAPIHTIHGFFQRVIMENAFSGGRLFEQTLVEARSSFSEEFRNALRTRIAKEEPYASALRAWLEQGGTAGDLEQLLFTASQKKCEIRPPYDPVQYRAAVRSVAEEFRKDLHPEDVRSLCKALKVPGATASAMQRKIEHARACMDAHRDGTCLLDIPRKDLEYLAANLKARPEAVKTLQRLEGLLISTEAMLVQLFLPLVRSALHGRKLREGLYDFDDMIGYLREALDGPQAEALIQNLRGRYRYALIDESQDTDEVQWAIFRTIFYDSREGNRIYLIGDPKQAIYGFRGADVHTYLDARKDICGSGSPVPLARNFRSTQLLIAAYNLLLDQKAVPPFFTGDQIRYDVEVAAGRPGLEAVDGEGGRIAPVTIMRLDRGQGERVSAAQYRHQTGTFIAREIRGLLRERRLYLAENGKRIPVNAQDIFILTRAEREGREVAEYLRREQVPFAFYKQDGLFQTREAEEIRDVLAAVAEPHARSKRLKAWMTRFFAVPVGELSFCRDLPDAEPLVRTLLEWNALARKRDYRTLFTEIIDGSRVVLRELFLEDNERSLTNFYHLFEVLLEETTQRSCDIAEVVLLLNAFIAQTAMPARDNGNIQRLETEKDAVQIMTLHKSKGLEASVVFLYGGFSMPRDKGPVTFHEGGRRIVHIGEPGEAVRQRADQEMREEHQRLLYVGITRARAKLYLPYLPADERPSSWASGPYNELNRRIHALVSAGGLPRELFSTVRLQAGMARAAGAAAHDARLPEWTPDGTILAMQVPEAELRMLRQEHAAFRITSYSRIRQQEMQPEHEVNERGTGRTDRAASGMEGAALIGGPAFGSAVHSIMEKIPFDSFHQVIPSGDWAGREEIAAICREALIANGIDLGHLAYAQELVHRTMTSPVALGRELVLPAFWTLKEISREAEFLYPFPEAFHPPLDAPGRDYLIGRGYVKGFIDMLFRFRDKVYFLDWKTDILPGYGTAEMKGHFEGHYRLQVQLYLLAMVRLLACRSAEDYERDFGGVVYCFMRGMDPAGRTGIHTLRPSWDEVLAWEQELVSSTEYI